MKKTILLFLFVLTLCVYPETAPEPVRGVWVTNIDSDILFSKEKIEQGVNLCSECGINTMFVVVWNRAMTLYPSKIMKNMFGEEIDPYFAGRDPLKELIEAAHKKNIKVYAWFEFGFSTSYQLAGGRLLKMNPDWSAIDNSGKLVQKNGFEWMNGFDPAVQNFALELIKEVVTNYEVDGVQGDDRLPAMPVEAGYEKYTVELYKKEHNGNIPPKDFRDTAWVNWRAGKMNLFMEKIYKTVKSIKKGVQVSMAPSPYPWGKEEYLQDWPTWLQNGWVDMVCPQLYREQVKGYLHELDKIVNGQVNKEKLNIIYPGILLKLGSYYPDAEYIKSVIAENRKRGINGEVFFFFEGLKKHRELFRELYR